MPIVAKSAHLSGEKTRVGKLSQIRELVLGAQDGLLVPLGVISSIAGAFSDNHFVLVAGISEALAGAFSMATGAYLSSQAEVQVYASEISKEKKAIADDPEGEKKEMVLLFEREGISKAKSETITNILAEFPTAFTNTMIQKELGLDPNPPGTPMFDALLVGVSYLVAAGIPLFPYFFLKGPIAIISSIWMTMVALFAIGVLKGKFAALPYLKSGLQVLVIGAGSGIGGYVLGVYLPHILGIK